MGRRCRGVWSGEQALDIDERWAKRLGQIPRERRARATWIAQATTVALYRHHYDMSGSPDPLLGPGPLRTGYVEFHVSSCMSRRRLC